jgi:hypothetical protein
MAPNPFRLSLRLCSLYPTNHYEGVALLLCLAGK